ncbi:putative multidrug resistance-associated protein lethal(2)03659 isoform X2 [Rhynchophorus ferrugineus]
MYPNLKQHDSTYLGDKIERVWKNEIDEKQIFSLWRILFKCFGSEFGLLGFSYMIAELFVRLAQPLALSQLLKYYEPDSPMSKGEAYMYSSFLVLASTITMLFQHNFMFYQYNLGVKIRVATTALVYRKALRLSKSSLAQTNIGQMVNLISNDVGRFETAIKQIHSIWLAPVELLIIMALLYLYVGATGMIGILFLALFIPLQMWLGKKTSIFRLNTALKTDERIRLMNEIISGIQVIKMYTWEKPFAKLVEISRRKEMQQIQKTSVIRAAIMSFHLFVNKTAIYLCILVYVLTGNTINAQYVYVITSFYAILRIVITKRLPEAATYLAEAAISVKRLTEFLTMEEMEFDSSSTFLNKYNKENEAIISDLDTKKYISDNFVELNDVFIKWNTQTEDYTLQNIKLTAGASDLTVIIGPVGSGKTTLLYTILRELPPIKGTVVINGIISYASQEPWLFLGSIRQNILFGQDFDQTRYEKVIKACALERDFVILPFGDETIVGDRGVSLSGGQRARINLARAVYKEADIYLLDDPLSAVDTHVGRHIFVECIQKYLKDKCVILVTHQLQYLRNVKNIYLIDSGKVDFTGTYDDIQQCDKDFAQLFKEVKVSEHEVCQKDNEEIQDRDNTDDVEKNSNKSEDKLKSVNRKVATIQQESRAVGNVTWDVYKIYLKNGGNVCKILSIFMSFLFAQIISTVSDYYITWWVNAEAIKKTRNETAEEQRNISQAYNSTLVSNEETSVSAFQEFWISNMTENLYISFYSAIIVIVIIFSLGRSMLFFNFCIQASRKLHNGMFDKIVYAKMRFFNTNPSGRILNRFSKDMNQVDEILPITMIDTIQNGLTALFTTLVVATVNPWMMLPTIVIVGLFYILRVIYISTSRDVKRIESTTRSPVYSHLSASLQGLTTIRAFGAQEILRHEFDQHQNKNSTAFVIFTGIGRAFGLWLDVHCVIYICLVTMSFLVFKTDTLGGYVGLSITQSLTLTGMFQWCMRQWSELENAMTGVERIKEYVDVDPETSKTIRQPPKNWPNDGRITFENLCLRYALEETQVLKNLCFDIQPQEKIGIVGRTGAGKSSIITALFRLAENEGLITIDEVDINTISLEQLRSKISIIPQEPVLFSGTLRKNLDPFDEFSDDILWKALEEVELKDVVSELPSGLESRMTEGGSNFSVGQRQLVCLARAIMRNNKILVLDEATANVDPQTDALIQSAIRRKFSTCTVLTIAHRLHTIMDSDKVLVMDAGRVAEFGKPYDLLQNTNGIFYGMVLQTGKAMAENLISIAERVHLK